VLLAGGTIVQVLFGTSAGGGAWHAWGADDAYITYRYAQNLAEGHGLVFNPGERVEGYTSLLHVLLLTPVYALAGDRGIYGWAVVLNLIFMMLALAVFYRHVRRTTGPVQAGLAAVLFGASPLLWLMGAIGMETSILMLLQLLLWAQVESLAGESGSGAGVGRAGFLLTVLLLVLARADGFLMPAAAAVYLLLRHRRREAAMAGGAMAAGLVAVGLWRFSYYGHLLPNTYYVKVSGPLLERWEFGARMLREIVMDGALLVSLLAFLAVWVLALRGSGGEPSGADSWRDRLPGFGAFFGILWPFYFVHVGGDVYKERFLVVLIPLGLACLLAYAAPRMTHGALVFVVLLVLLVQLRPLALDNRFVYVSSKYDAWITLGEHLKRERPGRLLAVDAAGKIPFFSGLRTVDMLGLTDETIAHRPAESFRDVGHNKSDVEYVLSLKPDLIAVMSKDLDQNYHWGLTRERYTREGYRLRYVLNCSRTSRGRNDVVDVAGRSPEAIREYLIREYRYGVLERQAPPRSEPD
jgi:hypothetical protein